LFADAAPGLALARGAAFADAVPVLVLAAELPLVAVLPFAAEPAAPGGAGRAGVARGLGGEEGLLC
jgi:hypothetical protein